MQIRIVLPFFSVADQLQVLDLGDLAAQGIKTIINNRPDNEISVQPESLELAAAAESLGMTYLYLPVTGSNRADEHITDQHIEIFARTYCSAEGPTLAFCRTGTRSIALWALVAAKTLGVDAVLTAAATAGYDLSRLIPRLEQCVE